MRVEVPGSAAGQRLDRFLAGALAELSRSRLQQLIDEGQITWAGKPVKASHRVKPGDVLEVVIPDAKPVELEAEALPLKVLHEDKHLLVIDKAAGMVVHPGAGHSHGTVVNAVLHKLKVKPEIGGELRPGIVHRLDKDTSGLMVIARTDAALRGLHEAFKAREVQKLYLALVHGVPTPSHGTWSTLYGRHPKHRQKFSGRVKRGKPAVTHWRVLEPFEKHALVEVTLETGRTHQIRVHFAEAGHPLLCDALYGKKHDDALIIRQALHAQRLAFAHPVTGKALAFEAKPPKDFQAALKRLRSTSPSVAGASRAP